MARPTLHGALVLLVLLAGCTGFLDEPPERDERAVAAVSDARSAVDAAGSYRYETDLRIEATGDGQFERVDAHGAGAVDATARRMNATTETDGRTLRTYVVDRTTYQECPPPWGFWAVENESVGDWESLTPAYRQLSLLDSGALRYEGTATVDGLDATLIVGEPTPEALQRYSEGGSRPLFGGPEVHDVRLEVWIDDGTDLPLRTRLRFSVSGRDGSGTASIETRFSEFGEPVAFELPEAALEDQTEMGCPGS